MRGGLGRPPRGCSRGFQTLREKLACVGTFGAGDGFGGALGDEVAAGGAAFGAQVYHPIGLGDKVEVMFNHQNRVAGVDEAVEGFQQRLDVGQVEAGGRFVEEEEVLLAFSRCGKVGGKFESLGLAAGE